MTFSDIVDEVCGKIGKSDDYAKARCLEFVQDRHKQIWDSYDWNATQELQFYTPTSGIFDATNAEKVISLRFDGDFLDPTTPKEMFESRPDLLGDTLVDTSKYGKPLYYWPNYDSTHGSLRIQFFPLFDPSGPYAGMTAWLLVKKSYNTNADETLIPNIEQTLITFALADMWEMLRQLSKYQAKLAEAQALLADAQAKDSPSTPRPRAGMQFSANGATVGEMTDSVCDIIGRWEPMIRASIRDRINRNWQTLYDSYLWPDSLLFANCDIDRSQSRIILPYDFDKVIAVRTNEDGALTQITSLTNAEIPYLLGINNQIFENAGEPVFWSLLPPTPIERDNDLSQQFRVDTTADTPFRVFAKGIVNGVEVSETMTVTSTNVVSAQSYHEVTSLTKEETTASVTFSGIDDLRQWLKLGAKERERKHLRILLLPNESGDTINSVQQGIDDAGSVIVCGKNKIRALIDDGDVPQLQNVQNILIAAAAADMLDKLGQSDLAAKYQQKAAALTQIAIKGATAQNTNSPRVVPFTENWYAARTRGGPNFWQ